MAGDPRADAWTLFDQRADTGLTGRAARVRVRLDGRHSVEGITVYTPAGGRISVRDGSGGEPRAIVGLSDLELRGLGAGWHRFTTATPFETDTVVIDWQPAGMGARLPELQIWGTGLPTAATASQGPQELLLAGVRHGDVTSDARPPAATIAGADGVTLRATLPVDPRALGRAFLVYELEGLPHWSAVPRSINGLPAPAVATTTDDARGGLQAEEISPTSLRRGENEVHFSGAVAASERGYSVRRLRIVGFMDPGAGEPEPRALQALDPLTDRIAATGISAGGDEVVWPFGRRAQPQELAFHLSRATSGVLEVSTPQDSAAKRTVRLDDAGLGWHRVALDEVMAPSMGLRLRVRGEQSSEGLIDEVSVAASPVPAPEAPSLVVTYPLHGECSGAEAYVRGFVRGESAAVQGVELRANGIPAGRVGPDGAFAIRVQAPGSVRRAQAWRVDLVAVGSDGRAASAAVGLDACPVALARVASAAGPSPQVRIARVPAVPHRGTNAAPDRLTRTASPARMAALAPVEDPGAPYSLWVRASRDNALSFAGMRLVIPRGAVAHDTRITVRPLLASQLAALDAGMGNVAPHGGGFRLGPHGMHFRRPVRITLPYSPTQIPPGMNEGDISIFFYDEAMRRWRAIHRDGEPEGREVVGITDHFTDFIAATLALPESPGTTSFNPNTIHDLHVADPTAGVSVIQPPSANSGGAADLSYPIEVPPGRGGIEPSLALQYSSDRGNGWLGVGWDLEVSHIEIDTRFGVPEYTGDEHYLLDGAALTPVSSGSSALADPREYRRRVEGRFDRIIRHGNEPDGFWWELFDKHGVRYVYGARLTGDSGRLADCHSGVPSNIARWYLEEVEDPFGNTLDWYYRHDPWPDPPSTLVECSRSRLMRAHDVISHRLREGAAPSVEISPARIRS